MTRLEDRQNLVRDVMQARDGARLAQPAIADRPPRSWPRSFAKEVAFNTQFADLRIQAGKLRLIRRARAGRLDRARTAWQPPRAAPSSRLGRLVGL